MAANLETLELRIKANAEEAKKGLDALIGSLRSLSDALTKPYSDLVDFNKELEKMKKGKFEFSFDANKVRNQVKRTTDAIKSGAKKTTEEIRAWQESLAEQRTFSSNLGMEKGYQTDEEARQKNPQWYRDPVEQAKEANEYLKEHGGMAEWAKENEEATRSFTELTNSMQKTTDSAKGYVKVVRSTVKECDNVKNKAKEVGNATEEMTKSSGVSFKGLKESVKNFFSGFLNMWNRIKRIATTMLIRKAIRGLISAMKEGVNNMYEWSKITNHQFLTSMREAKAKVLTLKNSLGAALSPAITALVPLFQRLASAVIQCANWINQFIALLSGQTSWVRAIEQGVEDIAEMEDETKKATGAAKEMIAAFDELNVINSGGGGGSNTPSNTPNYENMFEEIEKFDQKIREIVDFIKEHFETIKTLAIAIGATIAAWKLSTALANALPLLSDIIGAAAVAGVIAITLQANWELMNNYLNTGENGWLYAAALTTGLGTTVAWAMAKKLFGGQVAAYTAAFTLTMAAVTDIIANLQHTDVSAFSKESIMTNLKAGLEGGAAVGIILRTVAGQSMLYSVAGGALAALAVFGVAMGLKASLDPNVELFSFEYLATTITSSVLAGFALYLFTGAVIPATVLAVATFGIMVGLKLFAKKDNIQWGDTKLTQEEIDKYVTESNQFFSINPKVTANLIAENISEGTTEKTKIEEKLASLIGDLNILKLGVDNSSSFHEKCKNDVDTLVEAVKGYANTAKNTGKLTLQFTPTLLGGNSASSAEWFTNYVSGWDTVEKWVEEKGKQIGGLLVENEKGEIVNKNPELLQTLMTSLSEVMSAITEAKFISDAESQLSLSLGDLTQATGESVIAAIGEYKKQLQKSYEDLLTEQKANQGALVAALGKIDPNSEKYKEAVEAYKEMGQNMSNAVKEGVESAMEPGKNTVMEWLLGNHQQGEGGWYDNSWKTVLENEGLTADNLKKALQDTLKLNGFAAVELEAMDLVGISGWEFLSEDVQKMFLKNLKATPETVAALKQNCNLSADEIFAMSDWDKFSESEKTDFINAVTEAYGSEEALKAAKNAGKKVGDAVGDNVGSGVATGVTEGVKNNAKTLSAAGNTASKLVKEPIEKPKNVTVKIDKTKVQSEASKGNTYINQKMPGKRSLTVSLSKQSVKDASASLDSVVNKNRTAEFNTIIKDNVAKSMGQKLAENFNKTAKVTVWLKTTGGGTTNKPGIGDNEPSTKAAGGFAKSGDLFIANENGKTEMIGRFGNQTAVANQDEIVDGISRGVAEANSQQNALLREQNSLLRGILQKSGNVTLGASSALGRTVKQSLDMYGAMVGGR